MYSIDMNTILQPSGRQRSRIPALMVTKQRDEMSIKHKTAKFHWQSAETLARKLNVLRVLAKRESEMLTRQAVGSSQRRQNGPIEVWTGVKGQPK